MTGEETDELLDDDGNDLGREGARQEMERSLGQENDVRARRDSRRLLRLASHPCDASHTAAMGAGLSKTVMDWSDIVQAVDADTPTPKRAAFGI